MFLFGKTHNKPLNIIRDRRQAEIWMKCYTSPYFFIVNFIKILHPIRGIIPFILFPYQFATLKAILSNNYTITLKPRQMGMSTLVSAYVLWFSMFHPNKNILLVSIKSTVAIQLLKKVKTMYKYLPEFLKMQVLNGQDTVGVKSSIEFANGSVIIATSSTEDAGRSEALSLLVMDEVAFQGSASGIWGAAQPALSTGGNAILLSTAFGVGNFFHETWSKSIQGMSGFYPIKLDWSMHPERGIDWYNEQKLLLGAKRLAQEVDCDFIQSGFNVFNLENIREIEDRLNERRPIYRESAGIEGKVYQYFEYDSSKTYVLGSDVASGRSRDNSTFSIMDTDGKEYACYKGKITPREFAKLQIKWGKKFGWATLAPEINGLGEAPLAIMQEYNYPNIYNHISRTYKKGAYDYDESNIMGWLTTGKTRHDIIEQMDADLTEGTIEIWNPYFVQEAYTFIYNEANKPVALGKTLGRGKSSTIYRDDNSPAYSDDSILGACITNYVRHVPKKILTASLPLYGGGKV